MIYLKLVTVTNSQVAIDENEMISDWFENIIKLLINNEMWNEFN